MDGVNNSVRDRRTLRANHGETPKANPGQSPRAPISLEGERRKAMHLIFAVEKDLAVFREKWLFDANDENTNDWVNFVNQVRNRKEPNFAFNNIFEFEQVLHKICKEQEEQGLVGGKNLTIINLQQVCKINKSFENLYNLSFQRIDDALNHHVAKYCRSYCEELDEMNVESVRQYENSINRWQAEIRSCLKDAKQAKEKIDTILANSFQNYISSYGEILRDMNSVLNSFSSVCDPFRSWITADEGYLKKIDTEISNMISQRAYITGVVRKNMYRLHDTKAKELRTSFDTKKLDEQVQGIVSNRKFYRKREFSNLDNIAKTQNLLQEKRLELHKAQNKFHSRSTLSLFTGLSDGIIDKTVSLQGEVGQLESELEKMKRDKRDLRKTRYCMQKAYHKLKEAHEMNLKIAPEEIKVYNGHMQNMKDITHELKTVDRKIDAIKRIYEIKTNPVTVKKIYFEEYTPGRKLDLRAIDMDFGSIHPPSKQMELRSLDKWKILRDKTSANALVRTLKTIDAAEKMAKRVVTVVN